MMNRKVIVSQLVFLIAAIILAAWGETLFNHSPRRSEGPKLMDSTGLGQHQGALNKRIRALQSLGGINEHADWLAFMKDHLTDSFIDSAGRGEIIGILRTIGRAGSSAEIIRVVPDSLGAWLSIRGKKNLNVWLKLEKQAPYRINHLVIGEDVYPRN